MRKGYIVREVQYEPGPFGMPFTSHGSEYEGNNDDNQEDYSALSVGLIQVSHNEYGVEPNDDRD